MSIFKVGTGYPAALHLHPFAPLRRSTVRLFLPEASLAPATS